MGDSSRRRRSYLVVHKHTRDKFHSPAEDFAGANAAGYCKAAPRHLVAGSKEADLILCQPAPTSFVSGDPEDLHFPSAFFPGGLLRKRTKLLPN